MPAFRPWTNVWKLSFSTCAKWQSTATTRLTVQVLWGCQAFNATPEEAAQQVVADLFEPLARGGVSVHVEESDGREYTLEVTAGW